MDRPRAGGRNRSHSASKTGIEGMIIRQDQPLHAAYVLAPFSQRSAEIERMEGDPHALCNHFRTCILVLKDRKIPGQMKSMQFYPQAGCFIGDHCCIKPAAEKEMA